MGGPGSVYGERYLMLGYLPWDWWIIEAPSLPSQNTYLTWTTWIRSVWIVNNTSHCHRYLTNLLGAGWLHVRDGDWKMAREERRQKKKGPREYDEAVRASDMSELVESSPDSKHKRE